MKKSLLLVLVALFAITTSTAQTSREDIDANPHVALATHSTYAGPYYAKPIADAPKGYKPLYCTVELHFNSTEDIIVLPKVLLNSKAVLASMKTDVSRANITGTCYPAFVSAGGTTKETDMAVVASTNIATYTVSGTGVES